MCLVDHNKYKKSNLKNNLFFYHAIFYMRFYGLKDLHFYFYKKSSKGSIIILTFLLFLFRYIKFINPPKMEGVIK